MLHIFSGILMLLSSMAMASDYQVWFQFGSAEAHAHELQNQNHFLWAISPAHRPNFIPDSFVMKVGSKHQNLIVHKFFQQNVEKLENNHVYDMFGTEVNWNRGFNVFYLGLRKVDIHPDEFLNKLKQHISKSKMILAAYGLKGHIVIVNQDYEAAFFNWESVQHMMNAFSSEQGKEVLKSGGQILDKLQYIPAKNYSSSKWESNSFYQNFTF